MREFLLVALAPFVFGLAWYLYLGVRGTIYLSQHTAKTSFPVSSAWYLGYMLPAVSFAKVIASAIRTGAPSPRRSKRAVPR